MNYDDLCPSGKCSYESSGGKDTLGSFPICGKDLPRGYYVSAVLLLSFSCLIHFGYLIVLMSYLADVLPWQQERYSWIQVLYSICILSSFCLDH